MRKLSRVSFYMLAMAFLIVACNGDDQKENDDSKKQQNQSQHQEPLSEEEMVNKIETLKSDMQNDEKQDIKRLNKLLALCVDLVNDYPDNEDAAYYLDLAAQLAYAKSNVQQSVSYYERLMKEYPNYEDIEYVHFMYANHLDLDLRKIEAATQAYEEFIEKYPESQFIAEARMRLENIDMTMEDIISQSK